MNASLTNMCELFIENRDRIKREFSWNSSYIYPVCAAIFTDKKQLVDVERLRFCDRMLKNYTGIFSNFRGTAKLAMVSMLSASPDPEQKMQKALQAYDMLKSHFFSSTFLPIAAVIMADMVEPDRYLHIAQRTRRIYDLMRRNHFFLTSSEDSVFAAMLALSSLSDEQIVNETESCYQLLKNNFFSKNAVQSLSHVLALCDGDPQDKCQRTMHLYHELSSRGCRYGGSYELANLGVLAMLPQDNIVNDIIAVDSFLSRQRGYGLLGLGRKQRLMHAGMLVSSYLIAQNIQAENNLRFNENIAMQTTAISSTVSLIVAQQAAVCAAVAASSAAAASSST